MEPITDSNRTFQLVEGNDDVLLFDKDTFTLARFKELLREDFSQRMKLYLKIDNPPMYISEHTANGMIGNLKAGTMKVPRSELN